MGERRDEIVRVRVTAEQRLRYEAAATKARRELSDWLRIVADDAAAEALGET
jgi:hypothetical protein